MCLSTTQLVVRLSADSGYKADNLAEVMCDNVEEIDLDDVELTFRTNILSQFAITKYAVPRQYSICSISHLSCCRRHEAGILYCQLDFGWSLRWQRQ